MEHAYSRGEIYYADLSGAVGSEQDGYRPVVIIQNDLGNRFSPTVIVAPISSKIEVKANIPTHCYLEKSCLPTPSIIIAEQIRTLDKIRLHKYVGKLSQQHISKLAQALKVSLGLQTDKELR